MIWGKKSAPQETGLCKNSESWWNHFTNKNKASYIQKQHNPHILVALKDNRNRLSTLKKWGKNPENFNIFLCIYENVLFSRVCIWKIRKTFQPKKKKTVWQKYCLEWFILKCWTHIQSLKSRNHQLGWDSKSHGWSEFLSCDALSSGGNHFSQLFHKGRRKGNI